MPKPYQPNDAWSRKARSEGYRARSVYKLIQIDERYRMLRPGMTVLDCGSAPGSWLQYVSKKIGPRGKALGVDLQEIEPVAENVLLRRGDLTDAAAMDALLAEAGMTKVDVVLSDIAPATSGIKDVDQWRSIELNQAVVTVAKKYLKPGGWCVLKVFRGADFDEFLRELKLKWRDVKTVHAAASRDRSFEIYVVMKK